MSFFSRNVLLLITFLFIILSSRKTCARKSDFYILALFSNGLCNEISNQSCNRIQNEAYMRRSHIINKARYPKKVRLLCTSFVNDSTDVVNTLLNLTEGFNLKCRDERINLRKSDGIVIIFTYMTFHLTRLASGILLNQNLPLLSVTFQSMYPAIYVDHPYFIYSFEANFASEMHDSDYLMNFIKELNVTYGAVVNLNTKNLTKSTDICMRNDKRPFCTYGRNDELCLKEKSLIPSNTVDVRELFKHIENDSNLALVVIYGSSTEHKMFKKSLNKISKEVNTRNLFLLPFQEVDKVGYWYNKTIYVYKNFAYMIINISGEKAVSMFFFVIYDFEFQFVENKDYIPHLISDREAMNELKKYVNRNFHIKFLLKLWRIDIDNFTFNSWRRIPYNFRVIIMNDMLKKPQVIEKLIVYWKLFYYKSKMTVEDLKSITISSFNIEGALSKDPNCEHLKPINCDRGYGLEKSYFHENFWDNSFAWHCKKCNKSTFKEMKGTESCKPCPVKLMSNAEGTRCYDPFHSVYIRLESSPKSFAIIILTVFEIMFVCITLSVFTWYRKTPIVLASNFKMSCLQLISHLFITIGSVITFNLMPSSLLCFWRYVVVGIGFTVMITVNISKTQKVCLIHRATVLMSKKEILITKATEWFIIAVAILLDSFLIAILWEFCIPEIKIVYDEIKMEKVVFCNNNISVVIQLLFAFLLLLLNGIQGVRARNLPSCFKETLHLTYSAFISTILLSSTLAVYFTEPNQHKKSIIIFFAIHILNVVNFMLVYFYKVFIILWKPHLNTRNAFKLKRLNMLRQEFSSTH